MVTRNSSILLSCAILSCACGGRLTESTGGGDVADSGPSSTPIVEADADSSDSESPTTTPAAASDPTLTPLSECAEAKTEYFLFLKGGQKITLLPAGTSYGSDTVVEVSNLDPSGNEWTLAVSTEKMGHRILERLYNGAEKHPIERDGHPGFLLEGPNFKCDSIQGRFRIDKVMTSTALGLDKLLVDFDFRCDGVPVRGCFRSVPVR
jgi:hypothetical protein